MKLMILDLIGVAGKESRKSGRKRKIKSKIKVVSMVRLNQNKMMVADEDQIMSKNKTMMIKVAGEVQPKNKKMMMVQMVDGVL